MDYYLNNLVNAITSDATNLTNLTITNDKLAGTTQCFTNPKTFSQTYWAKLFVVSHQLSHKNRTQININALTRYRGVRIARSQNKNIGIRSVIAGRIDKKNDVGYSR